MTSTGIPVPPISQATVSESIAINAPARLVYDMVSDVSRMGEWSPEATGAKRRDPGVELRVGDTFVGTNKWGLARWSTRCTVLVANPGGCFAFKVAVPGFPISTWRYDFAESEGITTVTESWFDERSGANGTALKLVGQLLIPGSRPDHNRANIRATLAALKTAAEQAVRT